MSREGKCQLAECECENYPHLRVICPDYVFPEEPPGEVHEFSITNWKSIPVVDRERCLTALRAVMQESQERMTKWRRQVREGKAIGSDQINFHFSDGMTIRNVLRTVMLDEALPPVQYHDAAGDGIGEYKNWDDFYYGALDALAREEEA